MTKSCRSCFYYSKPIHFGDITCGVNPGGNASDCWDYEEVEREIVPPSSTALMGVALLRRFAVQHLTSLVVYEEEGATDRWAAIQLSAERLLVEVRKCYMHKKTTLAEGRAIINASGRVLDLLSLEGRTLKWERFRSGAPSTREATSIMRYLT